METINSALYIHNTQLLPDRNIQNNSVKQLGALEL